MPSFSGRFDYLAPGRGSVRSGDCELQFDERTVTIVSDAPPLAFDLGDIDVIQPGDYSIRLSLYDGHAIELTRFAKAFQDLERQLLDAYRDRLVECLLVSDLKEVARFNGHVQLESPSRGCSGPAEVRLYESNLAVLPDGAVGFQWRLADLDRVEFDEANYAVAITQGHERLVIGRLAKRTGELAEKLRSRTTALKERSARALHAVFPFLSPSEFSQVAALMREGASVPIESLGRVHRLIESVLLESVVDAALRPYVHALARRSAGTWYVGYKIIRSETGDDQATGGAEIEMAEPPVVPEDAPENARATEAADPDAARVLDLGDGLEALFWFFFPLSHAGAVADHVAWEATSRGGRATYLFKLTGGQPVEEAIASINRGLVSLNFRREPVYLDARTLESALRYRHYAIAQRKLAELGRVRESFAGRAIHTTPAAWAKKLDGLLG
jgi:hypothetical protein